MKNPLNWNSKRKFETRKIIFSVIGCGSIGKRHIKNLIDLGQIVNAYDPESKALTDVKALGANPVSDYEKAFAQCDCVVICTPNHLHKKNILDAISNKKHIFVEKPLCIDGDLKEIEKSLDKDRILMVGYNLLHHELFKRLKSLTNIYGRPYHVDIEYGSYLPNWRKTNYLENYAAKKESGGGIIFDDIHEINYARNIFGPFETLVCIKKKVSDLQIDVEDSADILFQAKDGLVVNMHMDYYQIIPTRKIKVIFKDIIIKGDFNKSQLIKVDKNRSVEFFNNDFNHCYIEEMKVLIDSIMTAKKPEMDFFMGKKDLEIALLAKESDGNQKVIE